MTSVVIHYKELMLKGRNRPWFVKILVRNLRTALADLDIRSIRSVMGRIEIDLGAATSWESVRERLLVALDVVPGAHSVVALPVLLVAASGGVAALALWWLAPKKSAHSLVD